MSNAKLAVRPYRHSQTHRYYLDLRPFGKGRRFFRTRAEAESERLRQHTLHQRHGRAAVGLPQRELSDFMDAKKRLAEYDKTITNATEFYIDHLFVPHPLHSQMLTGGATTVRDGSCTEVYETPMSHHEYQCTRCRTQW